ncbi:hypothetical protein JK358_22015 [Nocardia sp. 2]|uniref:S-adenosyl methyltransferase n=1 Tax=Nocardia acididurans TaxID=2802282 RepID=A0ABS1MD13_9NOCA|nr:class I SAM-dependent methyltransferase [Nocardia acididurans]MBL1077078.1 hypothetical protein [Nocardia acididurans]
MTATIVTREPAPPVRAHRRLLAAARCRFAEDRLADAVSAGIGQVLLVGTALDTFCAHNPYHGLRVTRLARVDETGMAAAGFDTRQATFIIHLGGERTPSALTATTCRVAALAPGTELILDYLPDVTAPELVATMLRDTGFAVLEDLDPRTLACRYLVLPDDVNHSAEPRIVRARVRHNVGRPPSSL